MTTPVPTGHSVYGASSAKRWTSCLASPRMCEEAPPSFDEEWTRDGKIGHALLEWLLKWAAEGRPDTAARHVGNPIVYDVVDGVELRGVVKPETARAVQLAADYVLELIEQDPDAKLWLETMVVIPSTVVPNRMFGTADIIIYLPSKKRLWAIDYKHGAGIKVDVHENMQLWFYALGALLILMDMGLPVAEVWTAIIQPRSFSLDGAVKPEQVSVANLFRFWGYLDERAELTLDDDAPFKPSADYCRWCPAATICKAYEQFALSATGMASIEEIATKPLPAPKNLPLARVGLIKQAEPFIRGFLNANNTVALGAAYRGYDIPGSKLVQAEARRAWYGDHQQIAETLALVTGLSVDTFYPRTLIGITEAEQLVVTRFRETVVQEPKETKKSYNNRANKAAEMARELFAQVVLKEPGAKVTLAPITDPRPRVDAAASNFAGQINVDPQPME